MLKVQTIALAHEKYGGGFACFVTFQVGERSYNTTTIDLTPEATRRVVELAISEAKAMMVVDASEVAIKGEFKPIPLVEEVPAPEFSEVDEFPAPRAARVEEEAF